MTNRSYPKATITQKAERALRGGHPWVYGEEILSLSKQPEDGVLIDVFSQKDRYLGTGFYNSHSKITVRLLSRNANDQFDEAFFARRLQYAIAYRKTVMPGNDFRCCRLIFGEADGMPGLTVDRFEDVLVIQTMSLGMEVRKQMIFALLLQILREDFQVEIRVIYERNDSPLREREGLSQGCGYVAMEGLVTKDTGKVKITENGIVYDVDFREGQKTGFFLDQKYNRAAVARLARGKQVLDCFTHTGAFALNAARGGATHVTAVDISADAVAMAEHNAKQNALDRSMSFLCTDVFDLLTALAKSNTAPYDLIILDPPAFTKSSATVANATRGYKEINYRAMKLLPRGGYLATCSCSHFMTDALFCHMLHDAAADAQVSLRQIEARQQSPDHPILWNVPETDYLKFYLFQVV